LLRQKGGKKKREKGLLCGIVAQIGIEGERGEEKRTVLQYERGRGGRKVAGLGLIERLIGRKLRGKKRGSLC